MGLRSMFVSSPKLIDPVTIREHCSDMILSDEQLKQVMCKLNCAINEGLAKKSHDDAIVKCFVTYVQDLPTGKEKGKFLALDLGGTNFRVLLVTLAPGDFDMKSKIYAVPDSIMKGTGEKLFDHIAECLSDFVTEQGVKDISLPLGFTFSFPLSQEGLSRGILKTWTKGFDASGVVGENVVELLEQAIVRRGDVNIEVFAILNDTTGTLMSCAWKDHNCKIGVIVGTGCNACYVEKVENCEMYEGDQSKPEMIVNTEWGAFGDGGELKFIRTQYDCEVDKNSINPGRQLFEKMISGMYMGELARQIIVKFTKDKLLFCGKGSDTLMKKYAFETRFVSEIESDPAGVYDKCRGVLRNELGLTHASEQDAVNVRFICECVSRRAADLCSAGLATLIDKMPHYPTVTIGVDGSVYRYHPHFHNLMMAKIRQLCRPDCQFKLMLSQDGSGRGAALVAAVISKSGKQDNNGASSNVCKPSPKPACPPPSRSQC
ncbi:hexokinase type 2 isoform X2 [Nilaparvata lugens]|uniref:hexokinase type 2 isoform X2 n=1 Tax=Nilaparvata lugens TaxID=108931 RepID=UPI00193E576E|nr:hexokinase type 2 isoform X2 [Nilaparvata lugens]